MTNQYQNKLAHLSQDEIETLMARYYNGEKSTLLVQEYNIDIKNSLLLKTFPLKIHNDKLCPFCNIPMISQRESKSTYTSRWRKEKIFCEKCNHEYDNAYCRCSNCKDLQIINRQIIDNNKREIILDYWKTLLPVQIEKLTLKDKLYLSALIRANMSEDLTNIAPIAESKITFAPTLEYQRKIITYLLNKEIIFISPDTSIESITIENDHITTYNQMETTFKLNVCEETYKSTITSLLNITYFESITSEERKELWLEIGLYECLEFLYAIIQEANLPTNQIGDKTILSIQEALSSCSISEVFYFIHYSVEKAIVFYQKEKISKQHAVNSIPNRILKIKEKALVENWKTKYGRHKQYSQTEISKAFFYKILPIGNKGFEEVIY